MSYLSGMPVFVDYETRRRMYEKGCTRLHGNWHGYYHRHGGAVVHENYTNEFEMSALTYDQALEWLRECKGIHVKIEIDDVDGNVGKFFASIYQIIDGKWEHMHDVWDDCDTYEHVTSAALSCALYGLL